MRQLWRSSGSFSIHYQIREATSQGRIEYQTFIIYLILNDVRYLHKGIFTRATSQVSTFQMCNFPKAFLGATGSNGGRALRLEQARGMSAAAKTDLGNCTFGKLLLMKIPLEKYPCEVAAWEKVFWKVPNIYLIISYIIDITNTLCEPNI